MLPRLVACFLLRSFVCVALLGGAAQAAAQTPATPEAESDTSPPITSQAPGAVQAEVLHLEAGIAHLRDEHEHARLGAPITVMAVGFGSSVALAVWVAASSLRIHILQVNHKETEHLEERRRKMGLASLPPFALGLAGGAFLAVRISRRSALGREIRALTRRHGELKMQLGPMVDAHGSGLTLRGVF